MICDLKVLNFNPRYSDSLYIILQEYINYGFTPKYFNTSKYFNNFSYNHSDVSAEISIFYVHRLESVFIVNLDYKNYEQLRDNGGITKKIHNIFLQHKIECAWQPSKLFAGDIYLFDLCNIQSIFLFQNICKENDNYFRMLLL